MADQQSNLAAGGTRAHERSLTHVTFHAADQEEPSRPAPALAAAELRDHQVHGGHMEKWRNGRSSLVSCCWCRRCYVPLQCTVIISHVITPRNDSDPSIDQLTCSHFLHYMHNTDILFAVKTSYTAAISTYACVHLHKYIRVSVCVYKRLAPYVINSHVTYV